MLCPTAAAISRTVPGSNDAPHASGVGNAVAVQVAKPVRHSSCAIAGMPKRLAATICPCNVASARAPAAGLTGRVPKTRVSWPRPSRMSSVSGGSSPGKSSCIGATPSPSLCAPIQMPTSCASFSVSVIRATRSATRSAAGRDGSRQISPLASPSAGAPPPPGSRVSSPASPASLLGDPFARAFMVARLISWSGRPRRPAKPGAPAT